MTRYDELPNFPTLRHPAVRQPTRRAEEESNVKTRKNTLRCPLCGGSVTATRNPVGSQRCERCGAVVTFQGETQFVIERLPQDWRERMRRIKKSWKSALKNALALTAYPARPTKCETSVRCLTLRQQRTLLDRFNLAVQRLIALNDHASPVNHEIHLRNGDPNCQLCCHIRLLNRLRSDVYVPRKKKATPRTHATRGRTVTHRT